MYSVVPFANNDTLPHLRKVAIRLYAPARLHLKSTNLGTHYIPSAVAWFRRDNVTAVRGDRDGVGGVRGENDDALQGPQREARGRAAPAEAVPRPRHGNDATQKGEQPRKYRHTSTWLLRPLLCCGRRWFCTVASSSLLLSLWLLLLLVEAEVVVLLPLLLLFFLTCCFGGDFRAVLGMCRGDVAYLPRFLRLFTSMRALLKGR